MEKNSVVHLKKDYQSVVRNSRAHRLLALKAAGQAKRVLPIFEQEHPDDARPRQAIEAIRTWAQGGRELGMVEVRRLSSFCAAAPAPKS